eukprot:gb/GFBE01026567.1/.p1 GENE.gb/GFBE01026567.1/~~gb/GFBE01026567.1/.p1  ORF type:complete len:541 (+),score=119.11 gb/GFBE01026567.1/:1-1623(+)
MAPDHCVANRARPDVTADLASFAPSVASGGDSCRLVQALSMARCSSPMRNRSVGSTDCGAASPRCPRLPGAVSGAGAAAAALLLLRQRGSDVGSGARAVASQSAFQVPSLLRPARTPASAPSGMGGSWLPSNSHGPAAAAVAAAVAAVCPVVARQRWPQRFRRLRHLRRAEPGGRVEVLDGQALIDRQQADIDRLSRQLKEEQEANAKLRAKAGQAPVVAGAKKTAGDSAVTPAAAANWQSIWETQRQNINVLLIGVLSAIFFGGYITATEGTIAGAEWFSCYVIEYSLSVDNLFVFIVIFDYFKVSGKSQSKVLNYGITGAVILRFLFIYLGAELLQQYDFLILLFAAILVYASYQGFTSGGDDDEEEEGIEDSAVYTTLKSVVEISPTMDGDKFFTEVNGRTLATPLFLCLLVIEFSDVVFATDSVPAVLGTTQDPFIAYTSNIFAVFGLRSLFFLLREAMARFSYLEPAVNLVLGFIGVKIVLDYYEIIEVPVLLSLGIVISILVVGIGLSMQELAAADSDAEKSDGGGAPAERAQP